MRQLLLALGLTATAHAQWTLQQSSTTADLRGIDHVGQGIAWASGSNGTVLHTTDNGARWQLCKTPPGAEHLDFRGIQAFDANTAIVMSSGKGDLSRLYKTTDGCQTWKLVFTNPDKDGFWDAFHIDERSVGDSIANAAEGPHTDLELYVVGDPVAGNFKFFHSTVIDRKTPHHSLPFLYSDFRFSKAIPLHGEALFAASNSAFASVSQTGCNAQYFVTGGESGARVIRLDWNLSSFGATMDFTPSTHTKALTVPLGHGTTSSGAFSIAFRPLEQRRRYSTCANTGVVVGGDYLQPDNATATSVFTTDAGNHWQTSTIPPHGYRSAVAYNAATKTWITVGPNGTDISTDDGRNWRALKPSPTDTPDADAHWNALSLPFVVGPHGRIGILRPTAIQPAKSP